jgi:hypothetical protein
MCIHCDVLPGNASNNLWILDLMLGLLDISSGGITINDNTLNITLNLTALILHMLIPCILMLLIPIRCLVCVLLPRLIFTLATFTTLNSTENCRHAGWY